MRVHTNQCDTQREEEEPTAEKEMHRGRTIMSDWIVSFVSVFVSAWTIRAAQSSLSSPRHSYLTLLLQLLARL